MMRCEGCQAYIGPDDGQPVPIVDDLGNQYYLCVDCAEIDEDA